MTSWIEPTALGSKAQRLWNDITGSYDLRADERRILEDACREIDLIERIEDEQQTEPLMMMGSMKQMVASPLIQELRQHRTVLARLLGQLKLPDENGRAKESASTAARKAANARWSRGA